MDFSLNEEQRGWQMEARRFAEDEIRPLSLKRDQIPDPKETWDWDIIEKGSKLGFRTLAVPEEVSSTGRVRFSTGRPTATSRRTIPRKPSA